MITGNFIVDIVGQVTRVDYVLEPPVDTLRDYDFIVYRDNVIIGKGKETMSTLFSASLINLVFTRVHEQTSLTPQYIAINVV